MADPNAAPSENVFDQMTPESMGAMPPLGKQPAVEPPNKFDAMGPDVTGRPEDEGTSSFGGAFARGAERGAIPAVGGLAGAAYGAEAGAGVGAGLGSVVPGFGTAAGGFVGGLVGGIAGGFGGSWAAGAGQDIALSAAPTSWKEALGQDDRQQQVDQKLHPTASFLGGIAPFAVALRPGFPAGGELGADATRFQRIMAYPATKALFGGAMMGGVDLGQEEAQGHVDWRNVAISTGMGMFFHGPNRIGQAIEGPAARAGAATGDLFRPAAQAIPPVAPEAAPAAAAQPEVPGAVPPVAPGFARFFHGGDQPTTGGSRWLTPDPIYARDFRSDGTPKNVHYVDIPVGHPTEEAAREWDQIDEQGGTNAVGQYGHVEAPEEIAKQLKPYPMEAPLPPVDVNAPPLSSPRILEAQRALWLQENPTVAMAGDAKVMGPGVTEDVFRGSHEQDPTAAAAAQDAARTEASVIGPQSEPDLNATARQMHPELFGRYDDLQDRMATFRAAIDAGRNPPQEAFDALDAQKGTLQAQIDAMGTYQAGPEARRLKAQIRDVQNQSNALTERRDAFAKGQGTDTPEMAAARQHLLATDIELRDLLPEISAARRRAADYAGTPTVEPVQPALEASEQPGQPRFNSLAEMLAARDGAAPAREAPVAAPAAPNPETAAAISPPEPVKTAAAPMSPSAAHERELIAADVTKRAIAAGWPAEVAEAQGHIEAAYYSTRAANFNGAIGTAADLYRERGPGYAGPKGRANLPEGAATARPAGGPETPAPLTEAPIPKASRELSLLEFLSQSGGLKNDPELKAVLGGDNPFVPGAGRLMRKKGGMALDAALRAASDAGYFHDVGEAAGAGPLRNDTNMLLDALSKEIGGQKQYRLGADVPRTVDTGAERHAIASDVMSEMEKFGINPDHVDSATMERTIDLLHSGQEKDPLAAYEKAVMEGTDQNARDQEHRIQEHGEIPGWDVPAEPGAAPVGGETPAGSGATAAGEATRNVERGNRQAASPIEVWNNFVADKEGRTREGQISTGYNDQFTKNGARVRPKASQVWRMGNIVDSGFVKNLLITDANPDGSFRLVGKPDADGMSKSYAFYPQEGLRSEESVDFNAATSHLLPQRTGYETEFAQDPYELFQKEAAPQTPAFKQWFGDSKVTNEAGEPLTVFHGTPKAFDTFDASRTGAKTGSRAKGIYFTSDSDVAGGFAKSFFRKGNVMPVYLKMERPRIIDMAGRGDAVTTKILASRTLFESDAHDGIIFKNYTDTADGSEKPSDIYVVKDPSQIKSVNNKGAFDPSNGNIYEQGANAKINIRPNARSIITRMETANASSLIHETGHEYLAQLLSDADHPQAPDQIKDDAQTVRDWLKMDVGDAPKRAQHEKFATGFEQYMREGVAPSPELAGVFAKFKQWLTTIYQTLRGLGKPINEDIRQVFDRLLSTEPQRTVIAEPEARGPTLADIHETDAAMAEPQDGHAVADRIASETERAIKEIHPEIRRELETEATRQVEAAAAATGGANAGPEAASGATAVGQVVQLGREPEPEPTSGGGGAERGEVGGGGTAGAAEGPSVPGSQQRRGARTDPGHEQFAPRGADLFGPAESPYVDKAGNIRLDNVNTLEDIKQVLRDAAAANNDFIGDRRGKISDGQVLDLAQNLLGRDPDFFLRKKVGDAYNAEQAKALELLTAQSAQTVNMLARKASTGTEEDMLAYAAARARHQLIQASFSGATAEAGRALRALRKTQEAWAPETETADQRVRDATGLTLFQITKEAKMASSLDSTQKLSKFMQDAQNHSFGRMLLEYYINALISGPVTHVTYGVGNTALVANKMLLETPAAAAFGTLARALGRKGADGVRFSEVSGQLAGAARGYAPALNATVDSYRTGATTMLPGEEGQATLPFQQNEFAKPAVLNENASYLDARNNLSGTLKGMKDGIIAAGALLRAGGVDGAPLFGTDYSTGGDIPNLAFKGVNVAPIGDLARFPSRNVAAIHSFFRSMNYSIDKSAQAYRTATTEGLTGDTFNSRVADLITNPSPEMMEQARTSATDLTLMGQSGAFTKALSKLLNVEFDIPGLGLTRPLRFIDPFVNIAANIFNQSLIQRTPAGLLSPEVRADLLGKNGNVAQDLAAGKMLVGTALSVTFGGLAAAGSITGSGPSDPKEAAMWRQAGNQAHSVRIGDIWYDVHRLGPLGMLMGVAADMQDVSHQASQGDLLKAAASLQHAFTQNMLDESFMRGPADLIQAVEDPGRYGENYLKNFVSSFVPYSVGMAQMARAADPYSRQARSVMDEIRAKVPGLSETLYPRRDIWGEPMANRTALGTNALTAIYETQISRDPVNMAMLALGVYPATIERRIRNVPLTDEQYDAYSQLAGRMAKSRLDVIVRSPDFQTWPDHVKHDVMSETVTQSREAARGIMMGRYPAIPRAATQAKLAKMNGTAND